jgi:protein-S-isoprenylcysteine O-methyltransferase Ste14
MMGTINLGHYIDVEHGQLCSSSKNLGRPLGTADIRDNNDAPDVKTIPPMVYLAGIVIGCLATIWMPTKVGPNSVAWTVGGTLICCGAVLIGSALLKFKDVGTTVRPDRAASTLVIGGPYNMTRNPMYLGLAFATSAWPRMEMAQQVMRIRFVAKPPRVLRQR